MAPISQRSQDAGHPSSSRPCTLPPSFPTSCPLTQGSCPTAHRDPPSLGSNAAGLPAGPPSPPGRGACPWAVALLRSDPDLVPRGLSLFGGPMSQSGKRLLRGGTGSAWPPGPLPRLPWGLGDARPDLPPFRLAGGEPRGFSAHRCLCCSRTFSSHCPVRSAPGEGTERRTGRALSPVSSLLRSRLPGGQVPGPL